MHASDIFSTARSPSGLALGGGCLPLHFLVAQMVNNLPAMCETWVWSLGWKDPLEKGMATTPVFLTGESRGQRSVAGCSHVLQSWTWLSKQTFFHLHSTTEEVNLNKWPFLSPSVRAEIRQWRETFKQRQVKVSKAKQGNCPGNGWYNRLKSCSEPETVHDRGNCRLWE